MSCSALLDRGEPCEVHDIFAGFPQPPVVGANDATAGFFDSDEAMTARHFEARNAFAHADHTLVAMGLLAGQCLRGERPARDAPWIQRAISDWCVRNGGGTVAVPAGAGRRPGKVWSLGHRRSAQDPDHVFVRDAALDVLGLLPTAKVWLYQEHSSVGEGTADKAVRRVCLRRRLAAARLALGVNRRENARIAGLFRSERVNRPQGFGVNSLPKAEWYWLVGA